MNVQKNARHTPRGREIMISRLSRGEHHATRPVLTTTHDAGFDALRSIIDEMADSLK